jgi:hypothetical protein
MIIVVIIIVIIIIIIIIILTGSLIFDEVELQSLFECIFVDIIFHTDPATREKIYFKKSVPHHTQVWPLHRLSLGTNFG